jgi:hypothetical protein
VLELLPPRNGPDGEPTDRNVLMPRVPRGQFRPETTTPCRAGEARGTGAEVVLSPSGKPTGAVLRPGGKDNRKGFSECLGTYSAIGVGSATTRPRPVGNVGRIRRRSCGGTGSWERKCVQSASKGKNMEQNHHAPNPSLPPKGVTPREWRRRQNTKFVGRIRARRRAGVRVSLSGY